MSIVNQKPCYISMHVCHQRKHWCLICIWLFAISGNYGGLAWGRRSESNNFRVCLRQCNELQVMLRDADNDWMNNRYPDFNYSIQYMISLYCNVCVLNSSWSWKTIVINLFFSTDIVGDFHCTFILPEDFHPVMSSSF